MYVKNIFKYLFVLTTLVCFLAASFTICEADETNSSFVNDIFNKLTNNQEGLGEEFIRNIIEDKLNKDIKIAGFDEERFKTEEEKTRYRTALAVQQIGNLLDDYIREVNPFKKADILLDHEKYLNKNLEKSINELNEYLEQNGGNISDVQFGFEKINVLGVNVGKIMIDIFSEITPNDYESLRKLDEQLKREAYAELGIDNMPEEIRNMLFKTSSNKEDFLNNYKELKGNSKEWLKNAEAYYAYSIELTDEALSLMEATGISTIDELKKFYEKNQYQINDSSDMQDMITGINNDKKNILNFLKENATLIAGQDVLEDGLYPAEGDYSRANQLLNLWADEAVRGGFSNINTLIMNYQLVFKDPALQIEYKILLEDFREKYNIDFINSYSNPDDLYHFYQNDIGKDNPLKLVGKTGIEQHTYISKVVFNITKKDDSLGVINIAKPNELNNLAKEYCEKFATAYKKITGDYIPEPKVLHKSFNSMTIELDYEKTIKEKNPTNYYDAIRNNFSQIKGGHKRPSLSYKDFVPTISLEMDKKGVYKIEAVIYASKFYHKGKTYTVYEDCVDENGEHYDGNAKVVEYYPYRQIKGDKYSMPKNDDSRNIPPDNMLNNKAIGRVVWEVNVGGKLVVPPYGVRTEDIYIHNFISD